jgi:hypothetical protein
MDRIQSGTGMTEEKEARNEIIQKVSVKYQQVTCNKKHPHPHLSP